MGPEATRPFRDVVFAQKKTNWRDYQQSEVLSCSLHRTGIFESRILQKYDVQRLLVLCVRRTLCFFISSCKDKKACPCAFLHRISCFFVTGQRPGFLVQEMQVQTKGTEPKDGMAGPNFHVQMQVKLQVRVHCTPYFASKSILTGSCRLDKVQATSKTRRGDRKKLMIQEDPRRLSQKINHSSVRGTALPVPQLSTIWQPGTEEKGMDRKPRKKGRSEPLCHASHITTDTWHISRTQDRRQTGTSRVIFVLPWCPPVRRFWLLGSRR